MTEAVQLRNGSLVVECEVCLALGPYVLCPRCAALKAQAPAGATIDELRRFRLLKAGIDHRERGRMEMELAQARVRINEEWQTVRWSEDDIARRRQRLTDSIARCQELARVTRRERRHTKRLLALREYARPACLRGHP